MYFYAKSENGLTMPGKEVLFGKTYNELLEVANKLGMPRYAAGQISGWLYKKNISSVDEMTDLSAASRKLLGKEYTTGLTAFSEVKVSGDGTKKYLFPVKEDRHVETAYIPERKRFTLCLSTQVGCRWGCSFCMTGRQGFHGNLSAGEILNQFHSAPEREKITNIVYMGMGEPLDNLPEVLKSLEILTSSWGYAMSPRRITVSTIGITGAVTEFLKKSNCHLAISLHTPFEVERKDIMPVEKVYPLKNVLDEIRGFDVENQRRISVEYIVFRNLNHSNRHATELAEILKGIRCRINLIHFNPIPGSPLAEPEEEPVEKFRDALLKKGVFTSIRKSRGRDISAACGLLSTMNMKGD